MTNKTRYIPLLLLLLLLFSCTSREERELSALLDRADSIADRNPDSALAILSPLLTSPKGESLAVPTAKLLRVKIDDKLYRPITSYEHLVTDTLLPYFRHHDSKWLPTALFYAGRICADKGDAPQAIDYYQQTLDALPEQGNERFRGLIHSQIGTLFYYQELFDEAIHQYEKAFTFQQQGRDTIGMIFDLRDIGNAHLLLERNDTALVYFERAAVLAIESQNKNMYIDVMGEIANLYLRTGQYDKAKKHIKPANISSTYYIISNIFYHTGQQDSAIFYFKKLLHHGNVYGKQSAFQHLSEIAYQNKQYQAFKTLHDSLRLYDDSIKNINNAEILARVHSLYNYQLRERQAILEKEKKQEAQNIALLLTALAIILSLSIAALWQLMQRRKLQYQRKIEILKETSLHSEKELKRKQDLISQLKNEADQIELYKNSLQLQETENAANAEQIYQLNLENEELLQQITELNADVEIIRTIRKRNEEAINTIKKTKIYQRFLMTADHPKEILHKDDWNELFDEMEKHCHSFNSNLRSLVRISETEYKICILLRLEIPEIKISHLVGITRSGVTHSCQRLFKKIKGINGSVEDLLIVLKDM